MTLRPPRAYSPSNESRSTPPKKTKNNVKGVEELGSILEELIYTYGEKQQAIRHINLVTISMLYRLRELHGSAHNQLMDTTAHLSESLELIVSLKQDPTRVQNSQDVRATGAKLSNAETETSPKAVKPVDISPGNHRTKLNQDKPVVTSVTLKKKLQQKPANAIKLIPTLSEQGNHLEQQQTPKPPQNAGNGWTEVVRKKVRPKFQIAPTQL